MSEKIYLRKCERYTILRASDTFEVNVEILRKCDPAYQGETNTELMEYLKNEVFYNDDWYETNKDVYGEEAASELYGDDIYAENEYFDSRTKGADEWMELGVPNEEWRRTGEFEIYETQDTY